MSTRLLTLINAIGCLVLVALVVVQWGRERLLLGELAEARTELAAAAARNLEHERQQTTLERDISVLKESLGATQQAAEATASELGAATTLATRLDTELEAAREQVTVWEAALKARDERILTLTSELAATRKRLDEAVARLKAAAKRAER